MLASLLKTKKSLYGAYDENARSITWCFDIDSDEEKRRIYHNTVMKWLRFCYGEDQSFKPEECVAALVAFSQFQMKNCEEVDNKIEEYMKRVTEEDVASGVKILQDCVLVHKLDKDEKTRSFCEEVAKTLLRRDNVENHFEMIADCLMKLPYPYLDRGIVGYGAAHSETSEFNVRVKYVKDNGELDVEAKKEIMKACNASELNCEELKELEDLDILDDDEMMKIYRKTLRRKEIDGRAMEERLLGSIATLMEKMERLEQRCLTTPDYSNHRVLLQGCGTAVVPDNGWIFIQSHSWEEQGIQQVNLSISDETKLLIKLLVDYASYSTLNQTVVPVSANNIIRIDVQRKPTFRAAYWTPPVVLFVPSSKP